VCKIHTSVCILHTSKKQLQSNQKNLDFKIILLKKRISMFSEYSRDVKFVIKYVNQLFELAEVEPRASIRNMLLENRRRQTAFARSKKYAYPPLKFERRSNGYCYYSVQEVDLWAQAVIQQHFLWKIDESKEKNQNEANK